MPQVYKPINDPDKDGRVKLTQEQRKEIKRLYWLGSSIKTLTERYNVHRGTIRAVINPEWYQNKKDKRNEKKLWLLDTPEIIRERQTKYRAKLRRLGLEQYKGEAKTKKKCIFCGLSFIVQPKRVFCPQCLQKSLTI